MRRPFGWFEGAEVGFGTWTCPVWLAVGVSRLRQVSCHPASGERAWRLGLFRQRIWLALCLTCVLCVAWSEALAAPKLKANVTDARQALQAGEDFERNRRWIDAIEHYEASIKKWPDDRDLSYGLRRSKIHFGIERATPTAASARTC